MFVFNFLFFIVFIFIIFWSIILESWNPCLHSRNSSFFILTASLLHLLNYFLFILFIVVTGRNINLKLQNWNRTDYKRKRRELRSTDLWIPYLLNAGDLSFGILIILELRINNFKTLILEYKLEQETENQLYVICCFASSNISRLPSCFSCFT